MDIEQAPMECYFLSRPVDEEGKPVREYRRMHNIQKEQSGTEITEQHLCDQVKMIKKNKWITKFGIRKHWNFKKKNIQKYTQ